MLNIANIILSLLIADSLALFEGDDCTMQDLSGGPGICTNVHKCAYAKKMLRLRMRPQVCGFKGDTPLVCCPQPQTAPLKSPKTRSEEKCAEYHDIRRRTTFVALGEKASAKEFPHMAAIGFSDKNILWLCGGSLISEHFVLTAAHCAKTRDYGAPKWVRLGDLDLKNSTEDAEPQDIRIAKIFTHEKYKPPSHYNDIALVKLDKEIKFGVYVKPACLHTRKNLPDGKLQAIGWGKLDFYDDEGSSHLMKVDLGVIEHKECAESYLTVVSRKLLQGILDQSQICAGDSSGKDTCPGDSGGPLHFREEDAGRVLGHYVVVGITSFGKACGIEDSIGVYTRVSSYNSWIEDIVWPLNFSYLT